MKPFPDFASWKIENLVNFAIESWTEMARQRGLINQMKEDMKTITESYKRELEHARKTD